ncbi:MAG: hypothetical protein KIS76_18080 [Pyrinomonadaceae bacterium]|nr:hypothetical protein [Pyrinomonadaceae bacterium]
MRKKSNKNIPTSLYALDGEEITIRTWESGGGEMPRQAQKAIREFEVIIDGESYTVYFNRSTRRNVDYYYLNYNDHWHWTRENIRNHTKYAT